MKILNGFWASFKKRFKRWDRRITLTKRQQFVAVTLVLTLGLVLTQLVPVEMRYPMVAILAVITYFLSAFALREDLRGIEWVTLLTLPTLFTAAVGLFYFLLPVRWLTRLPVAVLYAVGIYALLLTENIYNVAANRTIGLLRAAHSVGFLLTLVTYFLLLQTVLAFRLIFWANTFFVVLLSLLLIFQSLWAMELALVVSRRAWQFTLTLALVLGQLVWAFSFWPVATTLQALFLTTGFYGLVGMAQQYLVEKLYKKNVVELFAVVAIVLAVVMIATRWRGNL